MSIKSRIFTKRRICLCDTPKELFLYLILTPLTQTRTVFILGQALEKSLFFRLKGLKIIPNLGIDIIDFIKSSPKSRSSKVKELRGRFNTLISEVKAGNIELYGLDHTFLGQELFGDCPLQLIEDGLSNTLPKASSPWEDLRGFRRLRKKYSYKLRQALGKRRHLLYYRENPYGHGDKIVSKYFTRELVPYMPKELLTNAKILDLAKLWAKKTAEEKAYIYEVFQVNPAEFDNLAGEYIVLFTQPLSEDGYLSEAEKLSLYKQIIAKYPQDRVLIKPHPRELTNYQESFPDSLVWQGKYPWELAMLNGIKVKRGITLFSTAVLLLGAEVPIDIYGVEVHPKLLANFAKVQEILPRNAYLEKVLRF